MPERTREERSVVPCPVCRQKLDDAAFEQAQLCSKCLALHHAACWTGACASCGARPSAELPALPKPKTARRVASRGPWETVKRVSALAWLPSFVLANIALTVAWASGWAINPFDLPIVLKVLVAPSQLTGLALIGIMTTDAILRGLARERGTAWPIVVALLGLCTGGISSFAYYVAWGRKPFTDETGEA